MSQEYNGFKVVLKSSLLKISAIVEIGKTHFYSIIQLLPFFLKK